MGAKDSSQQRCTTGAGLKGSVPELAGSNHLRRVRLVCPWASIHSNVSKPLLFTQNPDLLRSRLRCCSLLQIG